MPQYMSIGAYLYRNSVCGTIHRLMMDLDGTFNHMHKLLREMDDQGLVVRKKVGRRVEICLTKKGVMFGKACEDIRICMGIGKDGKIS